MTGPTPAGATLAQALARGVERLAATSSSARLDAEILLRHVTGLTRTQLLTQSDRVVDAEAAARFEALIERRTRGEPVAYLVGRRDFWSLELAVSPAVLIPRPETELLVERALAHLPTDKPALVADLGTGSGAVAAAIAHERPRARLMATDVSRDALAVARENLRRLGLTNVEVRDGEWLAPLAGLRFDLIVSNPPYIAADDPHLAEGDLRFESRHALEAGPDGLAALRVIIEQARPQLRPGAWLIVEHGYDQGARVRALFERFGYLGNRTYQDLAAVERVTEGRAP